MKNESASTRASYDYYLICATAGILFIISAICIYGMFYFKFAQIHQMPAVEKTAYMQGMNNFISPFITALIVLLGICIPKRLFQVSLLNRYSTTLVIASFLTSILFDIKTGLLLVLSVSLILQLLVLGMAIIGNENLHFEKKGYWTRIGSSLIHLGVIGFILDLYFYNVMTLHLFLFWITTVSIVGGMLLCFYSESVVRIANLVNKETQI